MKRPDRPAPDGGDRLHRASRIVSLVGGILAIPAAIAGIVYGAIQLRGSPATTTLQQPNCVAAHGLDSAHEVTEVDVNASSGDYGAWTVRECSLPPPEGADPDGYSTISITAGPGPGLTEAEGMTVAFRFESRCERLEAAFTFESQGTREVEDPIRIDQQDVLRVEGGQPVFLEDPELRYQFKPRRYESIILGNTRYGFDDVSCD